MLVTSEYYRVTEPENASQVILSCLPSFTSEETDSKRLNALQIVSERTGTKPLKSDSVHYSFHSTIVLEKASFIRKIDLQH